MTQVCCHRKYQDFEMRMYAVHCGYRSLTFAILRTVGSTSLSHQGSTMLRALSQRVGTAVVTQLRHNVQRSSLGAASVRYSHGKQESDAEFDARYEAYFNRPNIDGWEIRKAMNDLQGEDLIPEPKIVDAAIRACRRINDFALAVRYLEAVKDKCGSRVNEVWPYMVQELGPTLDELGIPTPEQLGYDKPELAVQDVYELH